MAPRPLEYCCACDAPTGRAGQGEDSLSELNRGPCGQWCRTAITECGTLAQRSRAAAGKNVWRNEHARMA